MCPECHRQSLLHDHERTYCILCTYLEWHNPYPYKLSGISTGRLSYVSSTLSYSPARNTPSLSLVNKS